MNEQRKYIRRYSATNIECYDADKISYLDKCVMVNISKGGIALESKKHFPLGEKVLVSLYTPENKEISFMTQILYSSQGGFATLYGAKFYETDLHRLSELNVYLLKYYNLY